MGEQWWLIPCGVVFFGFGTLAIMYGVFDYYNTDILSDNHGPNVDGSVTGLYNVPFISDCLRYYPSSGVGILGFSIMVVFVVITLIFKFRLNRHIILRSADSQITVRRRKGLDFLNVLCLVVGIISFVGLLGVLGFPEQISGGIHIWFAVQVFVGGLIYALLTIILTLLFLPQYRRWYILIIQIFIELVGIAMGITFASTNGDPSSSTEIVLAIMLILFLTSFALDFRKMELEYHVVRDQYCGYNPNHMNKEHNKPNHINMPNVLPPPGAVIAPVSTTV